MAMASPYLLVGQPATYFCLILFVMSLSDGASVPISSSSPIPFDSLADLEELTSSKILMDPTSSSIQKNEDISKKFSANQQQPRPEVYSGKERNSYEMSSPLHVARCRATCLQKFNAQPKTKSVTPAVDQIHLIPLLRLRRSVKKSCLEETDCQTCWKSCELFEPQIPVELGGKPQVEINEGGKQSWEIKGKQVIDCSTLDLKQCSPGCKLACSFYASHFPEERKGAFKQDPVVATRHESCLKIVPGKITWPILPGDSISVVYVVIQEYPERKWRQIAQTQGTSIDIPTELTSAMNSKLRSVRVLVVGPEGLLLVYSPEKIDKREERTSSETTTPNDPVDSTITSPTNNDLHVEGPFSFEPRVVSLIHQKSLVIAELRWDEISPNQEYLITWELSGGGLKGHLVTDSTSVTLSLWPDTTYQIQVEQFLLNLGDGEAESSPPSIKSLPLIVDTCEASYPMEKPSALLSSMEEEEEDYEDEDVSLREGNETGGELPKHKSFTGGFLNMTLLLCIAISALIFVLVILAVAAFTWTKMRKVSLESRPDGSSSPMITPKHCEISGMEPEPLLSDDFYYEEYCRVPSPVYYTTTREPYGEKDSRRPTTVSVISSTSGDTSNQSIRVPSDYYYYKSISSNMAYSLLSDPTPASGKTCGLP